jgi:hypothetical protein
MNLLQYLQLLPDDITRQIIPYTYKPQNTILLNEIRLYKKTTKYKIYSLNYNIINSLSWGSFNLM